ncbi:MAG: oxygen-independent coproporphyrinogen III oxidase [Gammaproteobacteria bacterium]
MNNKTLVTTHSVDNPAVSATPATYWDIDLINKYDLTGPRYTSYPSAVQFHTSYGETDWIKACHAVRTHHDDHAALYVHIPFCDTICYYCGCNKIVTANRSKAATYLAYLKKEITFKAKHLGANTTVDALHLGGGTPTYLNDDQLNELIQHLRAHFNFTPDIECAIEIHPQTVSPERIQRLKAIGFNRISLGVQDFDPEVQTAVNRYNTAEEVAALIDAARRAGFRSCSIDLMYGLPLQTVDRFTQTLTRLIALSPDRISLFNYAHLPHLFKTQKQIQTEQLPSAPEKLHILHTTIDALCTHGYEFIGMDHFAKTNDELSIAQRNGHLHRSFQGYSTRGYRVLHAFGVSSISSLANHYSQNAKDLTTYYALLDQDKLPIERGYVLNAEDTLRRHIINRLMCQFHLDIATLNAQFGIDFFTHFAPEIAALKTLQGDGLLSLSPATLTIHERGRLLVRSVCKHFDQYAQNDATERTRYSRII